MVKHNIRIGQDALIAWDTFITDSDWHQLEGGNSFEDVVIGDHVWIGNGAKVLKGSTIGADSIVAAGAIVTRGIYPPASLLAGVPARLTRTGIPTWHR